MWQWALLEPLAAAFLLHVWLKSWVWFFVQNKIYRWEETTSSFTIPHFYLQSSWSAVSTLIGGGDACSCRTCVKMEDKARCRSTDLHTLFYIKTMSCPAVFYVNRIQSCLGLPGLLLCQETFHWQLSAQWHLFKKENKPNSDISCITTSLPGTQSILGILRIYPHSHFWVLSRRDVATLLMLHPPISPPPCCLWPGTPRTALSCLAWPSMCKSHHCFLGTRSGYTAAMERFVLLKNTAFLRMKMCSFRPIWYFELAGF